LAKGRIDLLLCKKNEMKKLINLVLFSWCTVISNSQSLKSTSECHLGVTLNAGYSKATLLDSIMKDYSNTAIPGMSLAVFSEKEGWWANAHGYASVEKKIPMQNCHLQYLQSVSKTYMAVAILQLKEHGKINLDASINKYLPKMYSQYIKNSDKITVRMLLNHTSGIPEYNDNPGFVSQVIEHPLKNFTPIECLKAIADEKPLSPPGSTYKYINTNYLLLSLIGNEITGDHAAFIKQNIFKPLGLNNTYYGNDFSYLKDLNLPQSYWDVFNNGKPVNVTNFQQMTVVCSKGDDGIVCTTTDAIKFFKGLMEGKLLNPESMKEMFDFVKDEKGKKRYGMGIIYFDLGGIPAYGHGGGGIGAGCGLMYIPSHKLYVYLATNLGVLVESELVKKVGEFRDAVITSLLQ
jgi:D-alanyl-D-alanine carboxypeptidase